MPLVLFREILEEALREKYAVGYFEAWSEDSLRAILCAAEELHSPIILGFGSVMINQSWFNDWGLDYFAAIGRLAAKKAKVPACLILNEAQTYEQCRKAIDLGFNAVMLDSSHLPFQENIKITKQLVSWAHSKGVGVEGELGHLPDAAQGLPGSLTDPAEAEQFVYATGIDALSVSIGNVHVLTEGKSDIDLRLLKRIRQSTKIPLVIHGGTGFPEEAIKECISSGVAKFNVGTVLKKVYYEGIKRAIEEKDIGDLKIQKVIGSRNADDFTRKARDNIEEEVKRFIMLYNSEGRVDER